MSLIKTIKDNSIRDYYQMTNNIIRTNSNEEIEYSVNYALNDGTEEIIKDYILNGNYNDKIKQLAIQLYEYTETENLLNCYHNLQSLKIIRDDKFKKKLFSLKSKFITGLYDASTNTIYYYNDDTLSHEFLHMASTPINDSDYYYTTGFKMMGGNIEFARGFNEGYTDLLNRRIFHNKDYNSKTAYKINIYLLRIFELLYDDKKTMERDYFISNYQSPIGNFMKYGSIDEFFKLTTYLDFFAFTKVNNGEDKEIFDLLKRVVKRISYDKLSQAEEIAEEYFESEKKPYQKILKL